FRRGMPPGMNTVLLTLVSPGEMAKAMGERVRILRLRKEWTRETLARRAGVSVASLKRFETTGMASLGLVLKVAHALDRLQELNKVFQPPPARSIEELEQRAGKPGPKRGRL
ncbi:MAG: helix-turn-helix transcriptional regulator, partial [Thermodesulfobacteriota bacterium]